MSDLFDEPDDATPLEPEERDGLLQAWITYRRELNEAEQTNIISGAAWARRQRRKDILTEAFLKQLHGKLFGTVWKWAGEYRRTERNIGIEPLRIQIEIRTAFDDARFWIDNESFQQEESAVRLHHRLVSIHPFPNGNGRTTRFIADLLMENLGNNPFTWGRSNLIATDETRNRYIAALRAADAHNIRPLLEFALS